MSRSLLLNFNFYKIETICFNIIYHLIFLFPIKSKDNRFHSLEHISIGSSQYFFCVFFCSFCGDSTLNVLHIIMANV